MSDNPFVLAKTEYRRDIQVVRHAIEQHANHLAIRTKQPYERCLAFVKKQLGRDGKFPLNDPVVHYLDRQENGDRIEATGTLMQYLGEVQKKRYLLAPTFTAYLHPDEKESPLVGYIDGNIKARAQAKKAMLAAAISGNDLVKLLKGIEQMMRKIRNNAISGSHLSAGTPLVNPTAHSTLTSNCRCTAGTGNTNNERLLAGNRHYWSPDVVRNNIISIVSNTDYVAQAKVMSHFNVVYPTVEQTMECLEYSIKLYWNAPAQLGKIRKLVESLSPAQRAAVVYTGDFYHFAKFNHALADTIITELGRRVDSVIPNADEVMASAPDNLKFLAIQNCSQDAKGIKPDELKGTPAYAPVTATLAHITQVVADHGSLFKMLFTTTNVPPSLAHQPDSLRRVVLMGDTDSTIFTVQDWVKWKLGKIEFSAAADAIAGVMVYFASETVVHALATMSANFGIVPDYINKINMKNEYKFLVFATTPISKHYYASIGTQEGNIFTQLKRERKGVNLKASNAPAFVTEEANKMMDFIMDEVTANRKISIRDLIHQVAEIERKIYASIDSGSFEYFRLGQINEAESYTAEEEESPYAQYLMWQEVFGPKYGTVAPPPYATLKLSTKMSTKRHTEAWLNEIEDKALVERIRSYLQRSKKKAITTLMLPEQILYSAGIPKEIEIAIDARKIVFDVTRVFYIILASLGYHMSDPKMHRMLSDTY